MVGVVVKVKVGVGVGVEVPQLVVTEMVLLVTGPEPGHCATAASLMTTQGVACR
jgi:hypothetical protein